MNTKNCTVCLETKPIEKFQLCSKLCKSCKSKKYYNPDYYKKYYETNKDYFKKYYDDNRESIISYQTKRLQKIYDENHTTAPPVRGRPRKVQIKIV